jgi:hypothetical protein
VIPVPPVVKGSIQSALPLFHISRYAIRIWK